MEEKRQFGLIGYPLKHSFSPGYFKQKFETEGIDDAEYSLYELEDIAEFQELSRKSFKGINVTIPYKEKVIPYLQEVSEEARIIGAVNTIKFENGRLIGYNTDSYGFEKSLISFYGDTKPDHALVLGSGGASKAVRFTLQRLGIDSTVVSRQSKYLNYKDLEESHFKGSVLIVNTTPLGTWPDVSSAPNIPYNFLDEKDFLYDLVYNPEKTLFLSRGEKQGASIKNGHDMLKLQAEKSWEIWNT
ncbi:shikimate dehydrogenase family protein [Portibacter lacus]|uniref:Shikimate 5-dehydrogenase n=1 Tax=Portibacter lacus TaxID=1099794 RepID=A0AA37WG56_9BACT|nr:shikimate dehydrogenase [Portibacter lacus]GLR19392.1 shikimate 5-dehydrogenase [Portibacter lacus]